MKKVLIVSYHFPPLNTMAAKRYGIMCKYMKKYGYEPYIITARPRKGGYLNSKLDLEIPIEEKNIKRIGALGIIYPIHNYLINIVLNTYKKRKMYSRVLDEQGLGWYSKVINELDLDMYRDMDIVVGTFPDMSNIIVARYIAKRIRKPFVVDIRDLISDYSEGFNRTKFQKIIEVGMEKAVIMHSTAIVTVTDGFKKIMHNRYKTKKIATIYNGWEQSETKLDCEVGDYLYYAGSLYEHRINSLTILFNVIKNNNMDINVIIRSLGPENLDNVLKKIVKEMNLDKKVYILNAAPENVVKQEQSNAKINLLISSVDANDIALMTTLPGKLFELIRLNQPVLAIANKKSEISVILDKTNKGKTLSNEEEIYSFLQSDLGAYSGYHKEVDEFSRENQTKKFCEFLNIVERG